MVIGKDVSLREACQSEEDILQYQLTVVCLHFWASRLVTNLEASRYIRLI